MKSVIIVLIILLTAQVSGQSYDPFPTDSATWSVQEYFHAWLPEPDGCIARHYGLSGDTIIDGKKFSKLFGNNLPLHTPYEDTAFNVQTAVYVAAVREDSAKKIWIRQPGDTTDILYYDFALDSGDTFCFNYFGMGCHPVISVDSILIDGNYRRQIIFQPFNSESWIEGIGSTTGWFEWQLTGSWSWRLLCFSEYQQQLYGSSNCHCDTYTPIENINIIRKGVKIYPTPATLEIHIEFDEHSGDTYSINVYSVLGKRRKSIVCQEKRINIDVSDLQEGIYLILISDGEGASWTQKIIKTEP